jgi:hypothetical protein
MTDCKGVRFGTGGARSLKPRLVLHEWGHTYSALWEAGRHIIGMRLADDGEDVGHRWSAWPNLQKFGAEASAWVQMQPPRGLLEAPSPPDKRPR